jgi:hypothetical protein
MAKNTIERDPPVALLYPQPIWFRILKYTLFFGMLYFFWGDKWVWMILPVTVVLGIVLNLWYNYKSHRGIRHNKAMEHTSKNGR